jgi:hypothetical protein
MERHIYAFIPVVGLMFIRLCTTSKCNNFTYNTSLYTRENKEEEEERDTEKEDEKDTIYIKRDWPSGHIDSDGTN